MVLDALRGYVELASGLTEVSRQRAVAEAKALLAQRGTVEAIITDHAKGVAEDLGKQVQSLADELIETSKANRAVLVTLIRAETERAVGSLGLATSDELSSLRRRVERLDQKISAGDHAPAKKAAAKKTAAKKTTKKAAAQPADESTPRETP